MNTTFANHDNAELGLVLVSTGVQKFGKPSAGRARITIRTLKLNADENLAYAAKWQQSALSRSLLKSPASTR